MVKKHKGGRRQILQLEDKKPARGEWEPSSTATMNKESTPLDSQVADFFKEIDALTVNEQDDGSDEANFLPVDEDATGKENSLDSFNLSSHDNGNITEKTDTNLAEGNSAGLYCPWQEICDESTGFNYYWNVQTNEVTWDCPEEYAVFLKYENSADGERATQPCQLSSNETQHKSRKRKENMHIPEGAIIPISYFGGSSSSDESCSGESENKLISSGKKVPKVDLKPASLKSRTFKKEEIKNCDNSESSVDLIGPQLPPDFQFPKNVPLAPGTSVSEKEFDISAKNEVEEYLEVEPQLPSSTPEDRGRNCNLNSASHSDSSTFEFTNPSQSNINGHFITSSSTHQDSWETSLVNIERKFKGLDKETGEESPDSTVKKGDTLSEHGATEMNNETFGFRLVVEYDSFTDEEDDLCSDISSSKQISSRNSKLSGYHHYEVDEYEHENEKKSEHCELDTNLQESVPSLSVKKSNLRIEDNSDKEGNVKTSKRSDIVDIDSLFAAHVVHGKYGFGFNRQKQSDFENDECSTSRQDYDSSKTHTEFKAISFVKSDHVFDLGTLNNNFSSDTLNNSEPCEKQVTTGLCKESADLSVVADTNVDSISMEAVGISVEAVPKPDMAIKDFKLPISPQKDRDIFSSLKGLKSMSDKFGPNWKKRINSAVEKRMSCKVEVDLDEIDKALCEALEAKKTSENSEVKATTSSTSTVQLEQRNSIESSSSVALQVKTESEHIDSTDNSEIMANIVNLYTVLVDKLSFLLSSHSTLASLSALLVQLQTRIVDWQAGALESKYFMSRLQEVHQYLHHYEMGAGCGEWTCQWDRYGHISSFYKCQPCDLGHFDELLAEKLYGIHWYTIMYSVG